MAIVYDYKVVMIQNGQVDSRFFYPSIVRLKPSDIYSGGDSHLWFKAKQSIIEYRVFNPAKRVYQFAEVVKSLALQDNDFKRGLYWCQVMRGGLPIGQSIAGSTIRDMLD